MMNTQEVSLTLTTTRLSPLAKPFTFHRTPLQPTSTSLFHNHPFLQSPKQRDSLFDHTLFAERNHVATSVTDATMFHKGKHAVDGLNPHPTVSDGLFEKCTGTNVAEDILSNSEGTTHAANESGSFPPSNCKVVPLKLSTTDMSSAKNTPQNKSSKDLGESDSDVDSPCWKGTMSFRQTPIEISKSLQCDNVEKATEKHNSLNPLAPRFIPGIGYIKDDFVSSNSCKPVATSLLSGEEDMPMKTVIAESQVELNKGTELQPSGDTCGREKAFKMLNDPKSSSVDPALNLHCMTMQSSSKEDCLTSKGRPETLVAIDNFIKETKDSRFSRSIDGVFPAEGHSPISIPTPSSSQVTVGTDLLKTFEGVSKALIQSSKHDVGIMVNAMQILSELLLQTCMDGVDSSNEHGCDVIMIHQIISNLNDFSAMKCGHKIPTLDPTLDPTPANSPFCPDRSLDLLKGLELTDTETHNIPHQLYLRDDYMGKDRVIKMVGQCGPKFSASSNNEYQYKGKQIPEFQVFRRSLEKTLDFDKQMHPEALLFWNLWLDSEAERCYSKYRTYRCLMEAGVDLNCANVSYANRCIAYRFGRFSR